MTPELRAEQTEMDREIFRLMDCLIEARKAEREIMKKYGFKTYKDLEEAKSRVAELIPEGRVSKDGYSLVVEERTATLSKHDGRKFTTVKKLSLHEA